MTKYDCPCCGYPTLETLEDWPVCVLCDWVRGQEKVSADHHWPHEVYDLVVAQGNFRHYRTSRSPEDERAFLVETEPQVLEKKIRLTTLWDKLAVTQISTESKLLEEEIVENIEQLACLREVEWAFDERKTLPKDVLSNLHSLLRGGAALLSEVNTSQFNRSQFIAWELYETTHWVDKGGFSDLSLRAIEQAIEFLNEIGTDKAVRIFEQAKPIFKELTGNHKAILELEKQLRPVYREQEDEMMRLIADYFYERKSDFL